MAIPSVREKCCSTTTNSSSGAWPIPALSLWWMRSA
ncbi:MAG TPA: hypothetical protein DCM44_06075 [Pantoea sp.]|nr:hypothetical protein [Pantoea sp.]